MLLSNLGLLGKRQIDMEDAVRNMGSGLLMLGMDLGQELDGPPWSGMLQDQGQGGRRPEPASNQRAIS